MKNIFYLGFVCLYLFSCKTDQREVYMSDNLTEAFQYASEDNKIVFIDFYTVWCGGCRSYDRFIFSDSSFQHYLKENFYSLKLDAEAPENIEFVKKYRVTGYPTLIITDPKGNEINRIVGFYDEKPAYYVDLIESMLQGKENFDAYKQDYLLHPDSMELVAEIAGKLFSKDEYGFIREFALLIKEKTTDEKIRFEANLYEAVADARDNQVQSSRGLLEILNKDKDLLSFYKEIVLSELIEFYKEQPDSFELFNYQLLAMHPDNDYYTRDFLEYLYLIKKNITVADSYLADFNQRHSMDHWSAYLTALSYATKNDAESGARYFDSWITKNEKIIDSDWPYFFYVKYAALYKVRMEKAIGYAYKVENGCDKTEIRINLAKLLHETGDNAKAIEKLKEVIPMISNPEKKKEIDEMIEDYSKANL
jgi:thioredoxin-related protein